MSRIQRKLQAQIEGLLLAAIGGLVLIACTVATPRHAVIIERGSRFAPATLTVRVGEPVVFRNRSNDRHALIAEPVEPAAGGRPSPGEPPWRSGDLYHNQEWSHRFERPGLYRFACVIHGAEDMVGTVSVE